MSDFKLSTDVEYHCDSDMFGGGYGRVDMHLILDEESRRAFYEWMADGCKRDLLISKDGLAYPKKAGSLNFMPGGVMPLVKEPFVTDEEPSVKK